MKYDYLVVGAGLFGSVFAHEMLKSGKNVLVIDRRPHVAGNIYTEKIKGVNVHKYGPHIFHTDNARVWDYINQFAEFNNFINSPVAIYENEVYSLPFNMHTFSKLWGIATPDEARKIISDQSGEHGTGEPRNLEEQAVRQVGKDIYNRLIKGYTEKQWGKPCAQLPASIINRLPVRFTYNSNYFDDRYQGVPIGGYTPIIERLLEKAEVNLSTDFFRDRMFFENCAKTIVFTGMIDKYYDYCHGQLEYRSLKFETEIIEAENFQGNAVVNYTKGDIPFTRIIEHKHFEFGSQPETVITREYPEQYGEGKEPYYPVNDARNTDIYNKYAERAASDKKVIFGGRLGTYRYYDMDDIIESALELVKAQKVQ